MNALRLLTTFVAIVSSGAHALSLPEAQQKMLAGNRDLAIAQSQLAAIDAQVAEARAAFHPMLNASASYVYQTATQRIAIATDSQTVTLGPGMTTRVPGMSIDRAIGDHDRIDLGADLSYPLFTGMSRLNNLQSRERELAAQQQNVAGLKQQLSFQLGLVYFAGELALKAAMAQDSLVNQLTSYESLISTRVAAGVVTRARLAEATARRLQSQSDLVAAQNRVDSLCQEIAVLINAGKEAVMVEPYALAVNPGELTLDGGRPELRSLDFTRERLTIQQKSLISRNLPSAAASLGVRYGNPGLNMGATDFMGWAVAGASVNWNIYDGLKVRAQRRQVQATIDGLDQQRGKLVDAWDNAMRAAQLKLDQAQRQREAVRAALEALDIVVADCRNAVEAGTMTETDYLDAVTRRTQTRLQLDQCDFMEKTAQLRLVYAAGREIRF